MVGLLLGPEFKLGLTIDKISRAADECRVLAREKKGGGGGGGGGGRKCMCYARGTLGVSGDILSQENALRSLLVHSCSSSCHAPPPNCSIELLHEPLHGVDRAEMSREYEGLGGTPKQCLSSSTSSLEICFKPSSKTNGG